MTPTIASEIINISTSREVWKALEDLYGATNKARKQQLKGILQNTKKGSLKMGEYLAIMKQTADNLALAGAPVDIDDLTSYVVTGLEIEYLPITCLINKDNLSWPELCSTLNTFENTLINLNIINPNTEVGNITANLAYNRSMSSFTPSSLRSSHQGRGQGNSRGNYRGRGHGGRNNYISYRNNKPTCQVCGKFGHAANICFHRFKKEFAPVSQVNTNRNSAYVATPEVVADPSWLANSGASNHVTPDLSNLQIHTDYQGKEAQTVGNGSKLAIQSVGRNVLKTRNFNMVLDNVLYVPNIKWNLLSISQLTCDNNCSVEFHSNYCFVRDKETGRVLLQRKLRDGLYQLNLDLTKSNKNPTTCAYEALLPKSESVPSPVNYSCVSILLMSIVVLE